MMKGLTIAICYTLGLLFIYAASSKLMAYDMFVVQIGQSAMLSAYAGLLAWMVPAVEIVLAFLLVFEPLRLLGLYASFSLMAMFTAYIFIILVFVGVAEAPCSCGGVLSAMNWDQHLMFNVVFMALTGVGVVLEKIDILLRNESGDAEYL